MSAGRSPTTTGTGRKQLITSLEELFTKEVTPPPIVLKTRPRPIAGRRTGRPPGAKNKRTLALQAASKTGLPPDLGMLPHVWLLRIMQGYPVAHGKDKQGKAALYFPTMEERIECAKAAAPYFAPRLSSVEVIKGLTDHELDAIIAGAAAEAGVSLGAGGEGGEGKTPGSGGDGPRPRRVIEQRSDNTEQHEPPHTGAPVP